MRFFVKKRRQPPAIIIVALIDILIVLLIFLLVTTTFKQQPTLKLSLPESSQSQKSGASDKAPVILSIDPQGNLRLGPEGKPMTVDRLKQELRTLASKTPGVNLAINADNAAPFGQIVKVMDAAKEAGIKTVNAFTKEPAARAGGAPSAAPR
jgi:biopolymer transport protein ExbD